MKFFVKVESPLQVTAEILVAFVFKDLKLSPMTLICDKALNKSVSSRLKSQEFKATLGSTRLMEFNNTAKACYLLLVGLGDEKQYGLEEARIAAAATLTQIKATRAKKIAVEVIQTGKKYKTHDYVKALAEGIMLGSYSFEKYLKPTANFLAEVVFLVTKNGDIAKAKDAVTNAEAVCNGIMLARDLVNTPASDMTPKHLADLAKSFKGLQVKIHDATAIQKMGMGAFWSVARGSSENPPYFIELHYKPSKAKKTVAIIGKGVTFDTGGYSLKPPKSMETMKCDMAGAAAVLGLMSIITKLNLNVAVSGYIAATENMVDGFAQKPGDVCKALNGKTIEVLNTDAEGRLTLADAMVYAERANPDYMIDMATLTGACLIALGTRYNAIMGNNESLIKNLIDCGQTEGEWLWQLPLVKEYDEELKSPIADLKNIGSGYGGTITAGLFLQHFVTKTKWAHLDIAGPAFNEKSLPYAPKGGSGIMVKTLARFLGQF